MRVGVQSRWSFVHTMLVDTFDIVLYVPFGMFFLRVLLFLFPEEH
jgi:hypothetical protein